MINQKYTSNSEEETIELGRKFSKELRGGDIVAFYGDLGSGKTEFIKGICEKFEIQDLVTSPTFTIVNNYKCSNGTMIYHLDLYRLKEKDEFDEIGFYELLDDENAIKLIEWAEKGQALMPENRINVKITNDPNNENKRYISISSNIGETAEI